MRNYGNCKGIIVGDSLVCSMCRTDCNIGNISKTLTENNIKVVVIPHSSSFRRYIKPYANKKDTGIIGVACVVNLLRGGYEMISLNIPSQCVYLDYSGCQKHWCTQGIPTSLSVNQLDRILNKETYRKGNSILSS